MEIAIKVIQFFLSLSILIIIHELGHFLTARYFNTRVEKFYLFFNPWFTIFKKKIGDTEYGMGWVPLGGYVKISGMIDESMDKEQMKQPPQPWEFRSKPAWQRLIVMLGGVTFNIIFAVLIYIFMLSIIGEQYLPAQNLKYGIHAQPLAQDIGLQHGDLIVSVDNREIENFHTITSAVILDEASTIQVKRNGELVDISIPEGYGSQVLNSMKERDASSGFIQERIPFIIYGVQEGSAAFEAGIEPGDSIVSLNGEEIPYFLEFRENLIANAGKEVRVGAIREGELIHFDMTLPETGMMGVQPKGDLSAFFDLRKKEYSLVAAVPAGVERAYATTIDYFKQLRFVVRERDHESLGGFITIGSIFSPTWDWVHFWTITAFLSIILAIMNILPIPALDGGHVMFLLYEMIVGKKPSDKFMEYAQTVGMLLLLGLIIFAQYNDIMRLFGR